jgi:hypothetical protein
MPSKTQKQAPKQESALLQILPSNAVLEPEPVAEPTSEPTVEQQVKSEPEIKPIARLKPKPQAGPAAAPSAEPSAELLVEPSAEPVETPKDDPSQPPRKIVRVVPRKVQEAEALGIELEPPPEEIIIPEGTIFQAVGAISGEVVFTEEAENKVTATITFDGKTYPLLQVPGKGYTFGALRKQVANHGATQRLLVYPRITHYPSRDLDYSVAFQLVAFDTGRDLEGISGQLQDLEFQLCGLWQFIPVCRTPCISVFKNFSRERLNFIKEAPTIKKVGFMKASHLPLFWRDAPVIPFRFNPKTAKEEQGKPVFVEVKAQFNPRKDAFEFQSLLRVPLQKPPSFLKASKADKSLAMAEKKTRKLEREQAERAAEREAKRAASGVTAKPQPKPKPKVQPRPQ